MLSSSNDEVATGKIYPRLSEIRQISTKIAVAVAEKAFEEVRADQYSR